MAGFSRLGKDWTNQRQLVQDASADPINPTQDKAFQGTTLSENPLQWRSEWSYQATLATGLEKAGSCINSAKGWHPADLDLHHCNLAIILFRLKAAVASRKPFDRGELSPDG